MERFTNTEVVDLHLTYRLAEKKIHKQRKDCIAKVSHRKKEPARWNFFLNNSTICVNMDHYHVIGKVRTDHE